MAISRIFLSGVMDPATNPDAPGGVAGALSVPRAAVCGTATTQFPALSSGGVLAVRNNGSYDLTLFYTPGETKAPAAPSGVVPSGGYGPGSGTITLRPKETAYLTDAKGEEGVTYAGGPFTVVPGTFQYAELLDPPERPDAAVTI
ncbi:hypothetical protein [Komagataeibacter europaeus]|uniref:hypothetical protein n=1 Tax=Komagataeibacter europaeus TaxID=33995 RepID=UPI0012DEC8EC|nr:hypothetical protein [Komagataeibacter europaeus]